MTTQEYINLYGEEFRTLITDSLSWLKVAEPNWGLDEPIDRDQFIGDLVAESSNEYI